MDEKNILLGIFKRYLNEPFSEEKEERILSFFQREEVKKKQVLFMNGDTKTRHCFIVKGLLRLFVIDKSGKEFNVLFAHEGQVIGDLSSPDPTRFNLDAIEHSVVYSISVENIRKLGGFLSKHNASNNKSHLIRSYIFLQKRLVSILTKTAEENYLEMLKENPNLVQRLPQYHIASYLGVSPEFLSKIIARNIKKS